MRMLTLKFSLRLEDNAAAFMAGADMKDNAKLVELMEAYGDLMYAGCDVAQFYTNEKLPFNYDHACGDYITDHTFSDHGVHVAGAAAGNNGEDIYSSAPNAQIVTMQVFAANGSGCWTDILAAIEDCVYLGVDVINMSLGAAAGFVTSCASVDGFEERYVALA